MEKRRSWILPLRNGHRQRNTKEKRAATYQEVWGRTITSTQREFYKLMFINKSYNDQNLFTTELIEALNEENKSLHQQHR